MIAVVGGGPAGRFCAMELVKRGFEVEVYEKDKIGGTCLNYGCTYLLALREVADVIENINSIKGSKTVLEDIISFKELQEKISSIHNKIRNVLTNEMIEKGIKIHFKEFSDADLQNNDYSHVVYATGRNYPTEYEGIKCLTHNDIPNLKELPEKILIIGGGVVAAELASIFSTFGSDVTVYVRSKFLKMIEDSDVRNYINKIINFKITNDKDVLNELLHDDEYTKILAIGGAPKYNNNDVDEYLRLKNDSNNIKKYVCGDAVKGGFTPIARREGKVVAENIYRELNNKPLIKMNYNLIPYSIRMSLNISAVGKQTNDHKTIPNSAGKGTYYRVLNHVGINRIYYENGKVVGCVTMTPATETVSYFAQYLKGIDVYKDFVEIHPSTDPFYKLLL